MLAGTVEGDDRVSGTSVASAPRPQWTELSYGRTGGQYHLGLVGVLFGQVLPALSPKVVAVTAHPRYWSFYTWLLWEFWDSDRPKTRPEWEQFEFARESLFSIGAAGGLCGQPEHNTVEGGIVGSNTTAAVAASGGPYEIPVPFLGDKQGGYGAQYAGSLAEAGLTVLASTKPGLDVDAPLPFGVRIAEHFRDTVVDTAYYQQQFALDETVVSRHDLVEFMRRACMCQLRKEAGYERDLLRDAFVSGEDGQRQLATFQLYVDIAQQTDGVEVDEQMFRELVYFRRVGDVTFTPRGVTGDVARHWRLFQLRYYFTYALDRLWQWTVEWSQGRGQPTVAVGTIIAAAGAALDAAPPLGSAPLSQWSAYVRQTAAVDGTQADGLWPRVEQHDEQALMGRAATLTADDPAVVRVCLQLLALVMERLEDWPKDDIDGELLDAGGVDRIALRRFKRQWDSWLADQASARSAIGWLLETNVIDQHIRIAYAKLPNYDTLRFSREGAHLRLHDRVADISLVGARFGALSTVVHELGYTGAFSRASHAPTDDGLALLEQGSES